MESRFRQKEGIKMNYKRIRKMAVLGAAVLSFTASSLSVSAATLRDVFDAEYYHRISDFTTNVQHRRRVTLCACFMFRAA